MENDDFCLFAANGKTEVAKTENGSLFPLSAK
jgi:hypothetical protein